MPLFFVLLKHFCYWCFPKFLAFLLVVNTMFLYYLNFIFRYLSIFTFIDIKVYIQYFIIYIMSLMKVKLG